MSITKCAKSAIFIFLTVFWATKTISAPRIQQGSMIRDAEIEELLREIIAPIFKVADLSPQDLNLYIIANDQINAAASIDNTIFLNTGLMTKANSFDEVIGVLAHETGHIALGHIVKTHDAMQKASLLSIASLVLGAVVSVVSGTPDAMAASALAGQSMAMGSFFHYSRGQEASADMAALRYLKALNWSHEGLISFMRKLAGQELRSLDRQMAYARTHPLSSDRVALLESSAKKIPQGKPIPGYLEKKFIRIKAKINAFMLHPRTTLAAFPMRNTTDEAYYSRAIAYYRDANLAKAIANLEPLLQKYPRDGFLHELKGQIYFEFGRIHEALASYQKAIALNPNQSLMRLSYVQVALEAKTVPLRNLLRDMDRVFKTEKKNPFAWHLLAVINGRLNSIDLAALALAEKELTLTNFDRAKAQAKRAEALSKTNGVRLRAKDIINSIDEREKHL